MEQYVIRKPGLRRERNYYYRRADPWHVAGSWVETSILESYPPRLRADHIYTYAYYSVLEEPQRQQCSDMNMLEFAIRTYLN